MRRLGRAVALLPILAGARIRSYSADLTCAWVASTTNGGSAHPFRIYVASGVTTLAQPPPWLEGIDHLATT